MLRIYSAIGLCGLAIGMSLGPASAKDTKPIVLHSFNGRDGAQPDAGLIADGAGNLYGTTANGGGTNYGTVFKLAPDGMETVLYNFKGYHGGGDGAHPNAGLIADGAGNFYGTTTQGGNADWGTVFKLAPDGTETVLYSFEAGSDGAEPIGGTLLGDGAGNLYGTAWTAGKNNNGTVFKLALNGTFTVLYRFKGGDGAYPMGGLIADSAGNLYGTTQQGGASGHGTVFKLAPDGTETVLRSFNVANGEYPEAGLIADGVGNLYGTTHQGGKSRHGIVFKLAPNGAFKVLHTFKGDADGKLPAAGLMVDGAGNLYGTTTQGGKWGNGTTFKLTPDGTEIVVSFRVRHGVYLSAGLIADGAGNLYGTALDGGKTNNGTVFEIPAQN